MDTKEDRFQVRAEAPECSCGKTEHMTVDEVKARLLDKDTDGSCPACGKLHFTQEDIAQEEGIKITETEEFKNSYNSFPGNKEL